MQNIVHYGSTQPGFHASRFCSWQPTCLKTRLIRLGINCFNIPWLWTIFSRCGMLQSPHLKNEPSSALIPYVIPPPKRELGTNCLNIPWFWTLFSRYEMLQSPHLKNEPFSALIPYVRLGPLPLAKYCPLWLNPTRLPRLTVLFLAAHMPQNASYKVRYQLS